MAPALKWAYAVTTVEARVHTLLPRTLNSLRDGGFVHHDRMVSVDVRGNAMAHWIRTLAGLYLDDPFADRYTMFQDDLVCVKGLRDYLNSMPLDEKTYLNLYTAPRNEIRIAGRGALPRRGWHSSDQCGKGALALVFCNSSVQTLLASPLLWGKLRASLKPDRNIDGCVVTILSQAGVRETVHWPSLVQHIGEDSAIGNPHRASSKSFPGESYNIMEGK